MDRGLTTIKAVVIGLGLAIVGVTVVLVMAAIDRAGDAGATGSVDEEDYADVAVALPAGGRVVSMTGEDDALSMLVELSDGRQAVVTVDRRSGAVLGTLELVPRSH